MDTSDLEIRATIRRDGDVSVRLECPCGRLLAENFDSGKFTCQCGYECSVKHAIRLVVKACGEMAMLADGLIEQAVGKSEVAA